MVFVCCMVVLSMGACIVCVLIGVEVLLVVF